MTARSVGYASCSTTHQSTAAEVTSLKAAGCVVVFQEIISIRTVEKDRLQLEAALNALVRVAKLDRLGRDQRSVINRLHDLQDRGIHIRPSADWIACWFGRGGAVTYQ